MKNRNNAGIIEKKRKTGKLIDINGFKMKQNGGDKEIWYNFL